jgi:altronate dehydratase
MAKVEKLEFAGFSVVIDPDNLKFDEMTLSLYIQKESGYYDNFGAYLALAERHLQQKETLYEKVSYERFVEAKECGGSDKLAEAKAKCDPTVVEFSDEVTDAKYVVNRLKQHLRAWDKNHDNAQSLGHMIRKEMDKLHSEVMIRAYNINRNEIPGLDRAVERTVEDWPSNEVKEPDQSAGFETDLGMDNLF